MTEEEILNEISDKEFFNYSKTTTHKEAYRIELNPIKLAKFLCKLSLKEE